jgi:hypothetical protein
VQGTCPPAIASAYASTPFILNTQYYLRNDGRALTLEGYELPNGTAALSVTGGIGGFFGASGDVQFPLVRVVLPGSTPQGAGLSGPCRSSLSPPRNLLKSASRLCKMDPMSTDHTTATSP